MQFITLKLEAPVEEIINDPVRRLDWLEKTCDSQTFYRQTITNSELLSSLDYFANQEISFLDEDSKNKFNEKIDTM